MIAFVRRHLLLLFVVLMVVLVVVMMMVVVEVVVMIVVMVVMVVVFLVWVELTVLVALDECMNYNFLFTIGGSFCVVIWWYLLWCYLWLW